MLSKLIKRPVLSIVISLVIVVLGIVGMCMLPVEQYPNIAPPTVEVTARYDGANSQAVMNSVVIPLEEEINGVEGMTYMTAEANNNGEATITVFFEPETDPDMAAVNVQNRVSHANSVLPDEVIRNGVTVKKKQKNSILMIALVSDNPDFDSRFLDNYADINIIPSVQRVKGVGEADVFGAKHYTMRVWLKPSVMAVYKLMPADVIAALSDQNIEAAPGELGQNSDQTFQYTLKYSGRLKTAEEFGNIIVRSENGQVLKLKDVADVELGAMSYAVMTAFEGKHSIAINIVQTAGSNAGEVIKEVKSVMSEAEKSFPPGVHAEYLVDANEFLDASINNVTKTLIEAFVLVVLIVLVFLQNFRTTLIPAIAIPVSLIGIFFFLQLLGFSINLITLFALVLAVGCVVDDAIVIVEAVYSKLEKGEKSVLKATTDALREIAPAIVSITLVTAAVFVPVSFVGGTGGIFFRQFGLTLAIAIILSGINALTLSPALSALVIKKRLSGTEAKVKNTPWNRFCNRFNRFFDKLLKKYEASLRFFSLKKNRWITVGIVILTSTVIIILGRMIPTGFIPQEDSGTVMGSISLAPGTALEKTDSIVKRVAHIADGIEGVESVFTLSGTSLVSGQGSSYGSVFISLKPWGERKNTSDDVTNQLFGRTKEITEATFIFFPVPTLQGFGTSSGIELKIQDKLGHDVKDFYEVTSAFVNAMRQRDEVMMATTLFNPNFPQKEIEADVAKIKDAGLTLNEVMQTLQAYVGSMYISSFNVFGRQFKVVVQAYPEDRSKLDDIDNMYVRTASGEMAPITEFLTFHDTTGPQSLERFNMSGSMEVMMMPKPGYTQGDIIKAIQEVGKDVLPIGYGYDYSGISREEAGSGNQIVLIFVISLILVYLILSGLYESFITPLAVIVSLPVGLCGVFISVWLAMIGGMGIVMNIYVQIALIMLIGLLAKNAILIVEYALQRRREGLSIAEAAISAAKARLRPLLMTSLTMIIGTLPLALSSGAGAVGNNSIGISVIGGMVLGTLLGVFVIPVLFILFQTLHEWLTGKFSKYES